MIIRKNKKVVSDKKSFFNGNYVEVELLGEGSYGKVYKARKEEFGVVYYSAIKQIEIPKTVSEINTLKSEGMTQSDITKYFETSVSKWVDEINFMSIFKDSNNIVNIEDYEIIKKEKSIGYIINIRMELLTNLETHIMKNNLTDKDICKMAIDITSALEDCEENDVVHRDIKPDNIFVNSRGVYKLGDFGIAKKVNTNVSNMSKKGTDNYIAPELYKNEKGNRTVDIYSLGIMLYRFFNYNRLPFLPDYPNEITPDNREEALYARINGEKMKPPINAPRDIAEIILKMCNYYAKDRYQSASFLKEDLKRVFNAIEKPKILFNYNEKQMDRLFKQNTLSNINDNNGSISINDTLESEVSSLESNDDVIVSNVKQNINEDIKEQIFNVDDGVQKNNEDLNLADTPKFDENISLVDAKDEVLSPGKIDEIKKIKKDNSQKIKSKVSVKIRNNVVKILLIVILLIIFLILFLILFKKEDINDKYIIVSNVLNMDSSTGAELLTKEGLVVEYEYTETDDETQINHIIEQSINKDMKVKKGTVIKLKVAVSKEKVEVIDVVGKTLDEAKVLLEDVGLSINASYEYSDAVESNIIISQMTEKGSKVNKGAVIEVLVSKGAEIKEQQESKSNNISTNNGNNSNNNTTKSTKQQTNSNSISTNQEVNEPTPTPTPTPDPTPEPIQEEPLSISLYCNDFVYLSGTGKCYSAISPKDTDKKIIWSSSNPSVISVDQDGIVTAHKGGTKVTITARIDCTDIYKTDYVAPVDKTKGDADGNGRIDSNDASIIGDLARHGYTASDVAKYDITGDGKLDNDDVNAALFIYKTSP